MIRVSTVTIVTVAVGLGVGIIGLVLGILWPSIYSSLIHKQLSLNPTSTNYELWKETPIPMYLKLYMFNLTNPKEFLIGKEKPQFEEMGPYVFRETDYKVKQTWNENNTITYQRKRVWHFNQTLSNGSLSDNVTNINPVAASVGYTVRFSLPFFRYVADKIMKILGEELVITKTVNELLFEGYTSEMLTLARKVNITKIPMDKFAWFYKRNNSASYDGTFNMDTGESNMLDLGVVKEWNYNSRASSYPGQCGVISGTNGDLWPPLPDNDTVSFFVSDICTSMSAKYFGKTVHEDLPGVTYISDDTIFDNGTKVPLRKCYYQGESIPSGAMNISSCKWGAPAFISLPHFYLADPIYREHIGGMNPQKGKHQLSISLEPVNYRFNSVFIYVNSIDVIRETWKTVSVFATDVRAAPTRSLNRRVHLSFAESVDAFASLSKPDVARRRDGAEFAPAVCPLCCPFTNFAFARPENPKRLFTVSEKNVSCDVTNPVSLGS